MTSRSFFYLYEIPMYDHVQFLAKAWTSILLYTEIEMLKLLNPVNRNQIHLNNNIRFQVFDVNKQHNNADKKEIRRG